MNDYWDLDSIHIKDIKEKMSIQSKDEWSLDDSIYGKPVIPSTNGREAIIATLQKFSAQYKQFEETKVANVSVVVETPTLAHALSIFAYHISVINEARCTEHNQTGRGRIHFFGDVSMSWEIQEVENMPNVSETINRAWDQFFIDGSKSAIGNRCAAREEYVKRCVHVLMRIAKGEKV